MFLMSNQITSNYVFIRTGIYTRIIPRLPFLNEIHVHFTFLCAPQKSCPHFPFATSVTEICIYGIHETCCGGHRFFFSVYLDLFRMEASMMEKCRPQILLLDTTYTRSCRQFIQKIYICMASNGGIQFYPVKVVINNCLYFS